MMNSSMIFHNIFLKSSIQKKPQLLIDFHNQEDQEMIAKKIRIVSANRTEKRMRSPT